MARSLASNGHSVLDALRDPAVLLDSDGRIVHANLAWQSSATEHGLTLPDHGLGANYLEVCDRAGGDAAEDAGRVGAAIRGILAGKRGGALLRYTCPDLDLWFDLRAGAWGSPENSGVLLIHEEVTERAREGRFLGQVREVLLAIGTSAPLPVELVHLAGALRARLGFDAAVIRLRMGHDYPYVAAKGLREEFVLDESSLIVPSATGEPGRAGGGAPVLACMCDIVLSGSTDPDRPFFTEFGSFWTNGLADFCASDAAAGFAPGLRNRCGHEEYETVVLVPLKAGGEILGLIHLCDRRKDRLRPDSLRSLEFASRHVAVALAHRSAADALRRSERDLRLSVSKLEVAQERIRLLTVALLLAESRERRRIATEIHDDLGQNLALAKILLSANKGGPRVMELIDRCVSAARSLAAGLNPPILELGLDAAMAWLCEDILSPAEIGYDLRASGPEPPAGTALVDALFCCAREILTNAVKHSGASRVVVERTGDEKACRILISDDGRGFCSAVAPGLSRGLGLEFSRQRMGALGGDMKIDTSGSGTTIRLFAPLGSAGGPPSPPAS